MLLTAPEPTPYDLRFRVLGIPVRVHPFFWLVMALFGGVGSEDLAPTLIFVICGFVSILVHEMGHALAYRACGQRPHIVLYQMGGLAIGEEEERNPWRRLGIVLAGPGAGLLLLLLVLIAFGFAYRIPISGLLELCKFVFLGQLRGRGYADTFFLDLVEINLLWTILNLLPIFPLDGGQASRVVLMMHDRHKGAYRSHVVSLVVAGLIVVYYLRISSLNSLGSLYPILLFGMLALQNFQILQYFHHHSRFGGFGDDAEDWWRR